MSIESIADEANRQIQQTAVASVPSAAKSWLGAPRMTDHGVQAIVGQVLASVEGNQAQMEQFGALTSAMLNPFDGQAENIQVPGQVDGTQLYFNTTTESLSVPSGADRAVFVLDAIGSTRNGETGATVYFVNSSKVSQSEPQNLSDGCIVGERRITTGLNLQQFDVCDLYSAGISAADRTSDEFVKGTTSAITYIGRDTWAPQMYPGKIGRLVTQDRDFLSGVSKNQRVIAVARNPAALYGAPFRQGYNQKHNTYANTIQGAMTYSSAPLANAYTAGSDAVACYAGNTNNRNFSVLAADAQLSQLTDVRSQGFTVGGPARIPMIPDYPAGPSGVVQIWSTRDMDSMEKASGGGIDAQFPRDCNAMRLSGEIRMTGPLNTLPYPGTSTTRVEVGQGIVLPSSTGSQANGRDIAGNFLPYGHSTSDNAINSQGNAINASTSLAGYNNVWWSGMEQPVGGWEVSIELLAGTETDKQGDVAERVVGRAKLYGTLGTKNNVFYGAQSVIRSATATLATSGDADGFFQEVSMNGNPIVTSESLGCIVLDDIVVRPGMGMTDAAGDQYCRGENITGARILVSSVDQANGQPRNIPCFANGSTSVGPVTITNAGTGFSEVPVVAISASPAGEHGTARAFARASATGVHSIEVVYAGYGYTSPPTVTISTSGASTPATATCVLQTPLANGRANAQQYGFELSNVNGQFLRYDADATTSKRQMIIMDGLIPAATTGNVSNASSNVTFTLSQYVSARLKAYKSPIQNNTSRTQVANNKMMGCALAEIAKYSPELFANELSLTLSQAIFFSMGGPETALHAASSGHSAGLWDIGKRMFGVAKKAFNNVDGAVSSLSPSTKAAIGNLMTGPEAMRALHKIKGTVGLSNVPDSTIARGAELANQSLSRLFSTSDAIGAGFFDTLSQGLGVASQGIGVARQLGLMAGTDSGLYGRSDGGLHGMSRSGAPLGAGFWDTLGKVSSIALPLMMDDGSYRGSVRGGGAFYAADQSSFPVLNSDGTSAGKLDLIVSANPMPLRKYTTSNASTGNVHFDARLESVNAGESQNAIELVRGWLKAHPEMSDVYVTVKQNISQPLFGRSWEASLAANLAGSNDLITGKISHVGKRGVAHIGPIVGAAEKSRMKGLIVPSDNHDEAPANKAVSSIKVY